MSLASPLPKALCLLLLLAMAARQAAGAERYERADLGGVQMTGSFEEKYEHGVGALTGQLESHPDVNFLFNPEAQYKDRNVYRSYIPLSQEYAIGIIVNPCGSNATSGNSDLSINSTVGTTDVIDVLGYDCCNNVFGDGEYGVLTESAISIYKLTPPTWMKDFPAFGATYDEISSNLNRIDGRGKPLPGRNSRIADDEIIIDEKCTARNEPFASCAGSRTRQKKFTAVARCMDNNQTVDSSRDCFDVDGNREHNCMQVATTQSAFVHVCGGEFKDDPHCGTFLEVHRTSGSPYDPEDEILAESKY